MQTPRFSGHPASAGDFVLERIPSRPILTSCANVGTVFPRLAGRQDPRVRAAFVRSRPPCAQTTLADAHYAERCTANPERPARNSARTPRGRMTLLASIRRGLLGFAGLASHSGRSSLPFRLALFRKRRILPTTRSKPPLRLLL